MKKITFTLLMVMFMLPVLTVAQTTITVMNTNDSGAGSFRQAVADIQAGGTILFDASLNGTTITLNSDVEIDQSMTINGNGQDQTIISGGGDSQVLVVTDANVTINNLTLTDGYAGESGGALWASGSTVLMNNVTVSDSHAGGLLAGQGGGGIYFEDGMLTLNASTVTNNEASTLLTNGGSGGGIMVGNGGHLTVNGSIISDNSADSHGGGIEVNSGANTTIMLNDVTLDGNSAGSNPGNGGGLHITSAGNVTLTGGTISDNTASSEGGGIWNGSANLSIDGTVITNNTASGDNEGEGGGGIYNLNTGVVAIVDAAITNNHSDGNFGMGGGILNDGGSSFTITDTDISGNVAVMGGGGIENNSGSSMVLSNVDLSLNSVGVLNGHGGGLHNSGTGNVSITGGVISNNAASQGGGLWNNTGTMAVANAHLMGNIASGITENDGGGGIFNNGGVLNVTASTLSGNTSTGLLGRGGGVHNHNGTATMVTSTISGNTALTNGGGIFNNGTLDLNANTITANTASISGGGISNNGSSPAMLRNSIVAGNVATISGRDVFGDDNAVSSNGYNLMGMLDSNVFAGNENDVMADLGTAIEITMMALANNNGGSTPTHSLSCPSPAADMGDPNDSSADQNGMAVFNGRRDIGAYESQEVCSTAGVEEFASINSLVYPNPSATGLFNLTMAPGHGTGASIMIYELGTGKLVKEMTADGMSVEIGMNNFASGTYVMQIVSDRATETHKLVVSR